MSGKKWTLLFAALALVCGVLSLVLLLPRQAQAVEVWSDGVLVASLPLDVNAQLTVPYRDGHNTVTVRDGQVAVTEATCPDRYCMHRGWQSQGVQIVCLPNRLVLKFVGTQKVDGVAG